ncbi:hypothetical protein PTSG_09024 [Salpingoeca rosetta]|uniref:Galactosylgalactosylxylosylprotein 3-beta-glucuronosyltransferase n=1 Tax=Salpingoeca rosetta (strain ATCC 50818 / BSB-021) TaxID=946362 RepID=F2ULZ9_SALR5|nr:uncharacterized protein PTSG_09024 [Salpingoeca rosetta]EGD78148.1 hypothetical protein PTSG_09024 [Salpingoeca rosetta]|eukprot:XP_004989824.1 hypothetical protein PTSG_09024 [Salpingoeca rosetta]
MLQPKFPNFVCHKETMRQGAWVRDARTALLLVLVVMCFLVAIDHKNLVVRIQQHQADVEQLSSKLRQESMRRPAGARSFSPSQEGIFVVTPTYTRKSQLVDLTRLKQALQLASQKHNLLWIVVEDSDTKTDLVTHFFDSCEVPYVHLNIKEEHPPYKFKANTQRNLGISYIRSMKNVNSNSKVYFADDDNAYDVRLFDEIAKVKRVGVWPVAYSGARRVETPLVTNGTITGFASWVTEARKRFPFDMAAFAVSVEFFLRDKPVLFTPLAASGTGEAAFLEATGLDTKDLEPLADDCTKVYVWHVKTYTRSEEQYDKDSAHIKYV